MGASAPLLEVLVRSVDTLVGDFDVVELAQQLVDSCVALTDGADAGLFVGNHLGELRMLAATDERARALVEAVDGPARHTYSTGAPAVVDDIAAAAVVWPDFATHASHRGYRSVYALPLRLRSDTLGALAVLGDGPKALNRAQLRAGQTLADLAAIGVAQHVLRPRVEPIQDRLPVALNDRATVEHAKALLAEHGGLDHAEAFARLRAHALRTGRRLAELAGGIVSGNIDAGTVLTVPARR
ncbi:GAF and ANTAR domain-containing protein [Nocardia higoensis]|uniref:GAF and ANTAR domain-containing protein n=1 Tax=Nocardia higoensis TaxID=228599 RepID=A0ABS0DCR3_9NOCA|nr:GAF and ANTAR domain-containing protein [Nocardia higoensis]MBF6354689.1 GAF and ANTAR domain-containing protein [Nocardia higoensis]